MPTKDLYTSHDGRVRQPVPTAAPVLKFDLFREIYRLQSEQPWQAQHTANTIAKYGDFRIVLVAMKAGAKLHEHKAAGRISIQALSGLLQIHTPGGAIELRAGNLATLDHEIVHDVVAECDSVFLLTIAWPEGKYGNGEGASNSKQSTVVPIDIGAQRENGLDETLAQTFPCSDPLSTNPDPAVKRAAARDREVGMLTSPSSVSCETFSEAI